MKDCRIFSAGDADMAKMKPFDEMLGYLAKEEVFFVNVYGIGQKLPAKSPCTYYLDCPGTLINRNSSGQQSDITLNEVDFLQYRVDAGAWDAATAPDRLYGGDPFRS